MIMNIYLQSLFLETIDYAFKRVLKLKDENSALKTVLCLIADKFNSESRKDKKGEFKYTILPEKDRNLNLKKTIIQVFTYLLMVNAMIIHIQVK